MQTSLPSRISKLALVAAVGTAALTSSMTANATQARRPAADVASLDAGWLAAILGKKSPKGFCERDAPASPAMARPACV